MKFNILNRQGLQNSSVKNFNNPEQSLEQRANTFPQQNDATAVNLDISSYLGTPVFSSIILAPVPAGTRGGALTLEDVKGGLFNAKNSFFSPTERAVPVEIQTALFDVSMSRNIVKTPVQGFNGTIKEYVSDGDYSVTINGILTDPQPDLYPQNQVSRLTRICNLQQEVGVISPLLNVVFGITHLVIESYSFPMTEGSQNVQHFSLSCVSDKPVQLRIQEEEDERLGNVFN